MRRGKLESAVGSDLAIILYGSHYIVDSIDFFQVNWHDKGVGVFLFT
jgi:hypothetical protein